MQPDPDRLLRVPILAGLTDDERARLASWLDVEEFADGTYLLPHRALLKEQVQNNCAFEPLDVRRNVGANVLRLRPYIFLLIAETVR